MLTLIRLKKSGLALNEAIALTYYYRLPGTQQNGLRNLMSWSSTMVSQVVSRLVNKRILDVKTVQADPDGSRKHTVKIYKLSAKGLKLARTLGGLFGDVESFNEKFDHARPDGPRHLPLAHDEQAGAHLQEELNEYLDADELEDKFDALIDLVYVALGAAHNHGFPFEEGWNRVHNKNMTKLRANGKGKSKGGRNAEVDIIKPPGFVPACLKDLVQPKTK